MFVLSLDVSKRKRNPLFIMFQNTKMLGECFLIRGREYRKTWAEWETKQDQFSNVAQNKGWRTPPPAWRTPSSQHRRDQVFRPLRRGTRHSPGGYLYGECHAGRLK